MDFLDRFRQIFAAPRRPVPPPDQMRRRDLTDAVRATYLDDMFEDALAGSLESTKDDLATSRLTATYVRDKSRTDLRADAADQLDTIGDALEHLAATRSAREEMGGLDYFWVFTPGWRRLVTATAMLVWVAAFAVAEPGAHGVEWASPVGLWTACGLATVVLAVALAQLFGRIPVRAYLVQVAALSAFPAVLALSAVKISPVAQKQSAATAFAVVVIAIVSAAVAAETLWPRHHADWFVKERVGGIPIRRVAVVAPVVGIGLPLAALLTGLNVGTGLKRLDIPEPDAVLAVAASVVLGLNAALSRSGRRLTLIDEAETDFRAVRTAQLEQLQNQMIVPYIRRLISDNEPSYETALVVERPEGLSQSFDPLYEIPTSATLRLRALIDAMPGGSIGVAGPRGVGKSTVLGSFCAHQRTEPGLRVLVSAPVEYSPREFLLHLYAQICRTVIVQSGGRVTPPDPIDALVAARSKLASFAIAAAIGIGGLFMFAFSAFGYPVNTGQALATVLIAVALALAAQTWSRFPSRKPPTLGEGVSELEAAARDRLYEIQFQQSISGEWTGTIKLPVGAESGHKRASGFVRQPKNLPDIVDEVRQFLMLIAKDQAGDPKARLIIGIDELDKIENDARAQQFLNDIKSIFGVPGCHFLVSVSEDAMASFERRGLPFRDVFDSAFDEIISIDYLSFHESSDLLSRRTTEIAVPFKGLSFCVSGGLPRDLIRTTRTMVDLATDTSQSPKLADVTTRLVERELRGKAGAVTAAIRKIDAEPITSRLILWCDSIAEHVSDTRRFQHAVADIAGLCLSAAPDAPDESSRAALRRLVREIACYALYCATLVEFFAGTRHATPCWRQALTSADDRGFDALARIRRAMSLNPMVGWEMIGRFRAAWDMTPIAAPGNLAGLAPPTDDTSLVPATRPPVN
ncbi:hypothetical protein Ade02nite_69890 [Paractinoplanes deccanensis]|uniref:KAP NTPase domain-containing protein n=2 Tax=Paractinoplanes deccanensis TaxID=113561 RepID=A0ABQ3YEC1_9ACTN|nr:hypothetical protein Ade02nite_69890 [Actinoplanes deccanensis]